MRKEIDTLRAGIERIEYPREYKQRKKGGIEAERAFVVSKNPFEQGRLEKNEANPDDVGARAGDLTDHMPAEYGFVAPCRPFLHIFL